VLPGELVARCISNLLELARLQVDPGRWYSASRYREPRSHGVNAQPHFDRFRWPPARAAPAPVVFATCDPVTTARRFITVITGLPAFQLPRRVATSQPIVTPLCQLGRIDHEDPTAPFELACRGSGTISRRLLFVGSRGPFYSRRRRPSDGRALFGMLRFAPSCPSRAERRRRSDVFFSLTRRFDGGGVPNGFGRLPARSAREIRFEPRNDWVPPRCRWQYA